MIGAAVGDLPKRDLPPPAGPGWDNLYRRLWSGLVRYITRITGDRDRAQDLAQEAFARALRHNPNRPRAWLFTVARNLAHEDARRTSRHARHLQLLKCDVAAIGDPEEMALVAARRERVRKALARLSGRDRQVVLLWNEGLTYSEIAARTGLATASIGTTLARARRRIAEAYTAMERGHDALS